MVNESRTLLPGLEVAGVTVAWTMGIVLLMWETAGGGPSVAGKWALYLSTIAAAWTVSLMLAECRRKVQRTLANEVQLLKDELGEEVPRLGLGLVE